MTDLQVRPYRKNLRQTAIILNCSVKTVRRYLDNGRLQWSGDQVSLESIIEELGRTKEDEPENAVQDKIDAATKKKKPFRQSSGWVKGW